MTEDDFTIGDEVQHRTGGPMMIYVGKSQLGEAICEWNDRGQQKSTYAYVALKKYEKPKPRVIGMSRR